MKEAMFYKKTDDSTVQCLLCPHNCIIENNQRGICGVRENRDGTLYSLVFGKAIAEHADPVEKKPLFHVYPGSRSFSISTVGCNLRCRHCQNSDISQMPRDRDAVMGSNRSPEEIVSIAETKGCKSISYTYTEPTIYFEYAFETAKLASKRGLKNIFVTNGYINEEPLSEISPYLDAANIDLKAFTDDFYKKVCGARLQPVLDAIGTYKKLGIWIEITTLIIPGHNDSADELEQIAKFIAGTGLEIPWHVTAYYPTYRLTDQPRTSVQTLQKARETGLKAGLRYVYTGNIPGEEGENTYCYHCGKLLIKRIGFQIKENSVKNSICPHCQSEVHGVGI
jgi:pyruvate formate lyase activating enzyme